MNFWKQTTRPVTVEQIRRVAALDQKIQNFPNSVGSIVVELLLGFAMLGIAILILWSKYKRFGELNIDSLLSTFFFFFMAASGIGRGISRLRKRRKSTVA